MCTECDLSAARQEAHGANMEIKRLNKVVSDLREELRVAKSISVQGYGVWAHHISSGNSGWYTEAGNPRLMSEDVWDAAVFDTETDAEAEADDLRLQYKYHEFEARRLSDSRE